ncbi:uncharacterized protein SPPG_05547 [Spizellomyces punctatus DAOM BR117]|uniref:glutathione gamma-glutamylcysteinyltransferase n=1 Tax=Spizellomyces punctatus (strain DAOM BR117) TaxID=645134 RepID=A0A0L0HEV1_SPIPD|nr:uncharacterized protein SPPG_05547 [Spizellomyces punctatus DAOM BR117]KNC99293.1 hypothetical protein SPPG_05547 [Spizellomyces punctatus DAOM BR117]|eukprot:XP_016607333.1 hypothetical protein SPPG_05547 [Spizellomyces punctatus DAOM BR117]
MSRRTSITCEHLAPPCLCSHNTTSHEGDHDQTPGKTGESRTSWASMSSNGSTASSSDRHQKMPSNTFYKRTLPSTCTPFNSAKGRSLFTGALTEGYMETYFALSLQYLTQSEPAYCGLSSLCMVLNALEIDPGRQWKGVWRWYDESMLDCCRPLEDVMKNGITLPEFVCLARCNGLKAHLRRADKITKEQFLADLKQTSREPKEFLVVSYDRGTLQQTGTGHFSPVGGYNESEDMVLILDVARFKYPAYWVPFDLLWQSLQPCDTTTGKPRGYVILKRGKRSYVQSALSQLAVNRESWPRLSNILFQELPKRFATSPPESPAQFISVVVDAIPDEYDSVVENRMPLFVAPFAADDQVLTATADGTSVGQCDPHQVGCENVQATLDAYVAGLDDLLHKLAETDLYRFVADSIASKRKMRNREQIMAMAAAASAKAAAALAAQNGEPTDATTEPTSSTPPILKPLFIERTSAMSSARISSPPMSPRYAVINATQSCVSSPRLSGIFTPERATSSSSLSLSLANLHPPNHPVNDFTAFLTMFLFALFSYKPFHENLRDVDADGDYGLLELQHQDPPSQEGTRNGKASGEFMPNGRRMSMAERVRGVVNLDVAGIQDVNLRMEVAFLRDQIAALTELQSQDASRVAGVPTPSSASSSLSVDASVPLLTDANASNVNSS